MYLASVKAIEKGFDNFDNLQKAYLLPSSPKPIYSTLRPSFEFADSPKFALLVSAKIDLISSLFLRQDSTPNLLTTT